MSELVHRSLFCMVVLFCSSTCNAQSPTVDRQGEELDAAALRKRLPTKIELWERRVEAQKRVVQLLLSSSPMPTLRWRRAFDDRPDARMKNALAAGREQIAALEVKVALDNAANPERERRRAEVDAAAREVEFLINEDVVVKEVATKHARYAKISAELSENDLDRVLREHYEDMKAKSEQTGKELERVTLAARERITAGRPPLDLAVLNKTANEKQLDAARKKQTSLLKSLSKATRQPSEYLSAIDDLQITLDVLTQLREVMQSF